MDIVDYIYDECQRQHVTNYGDFAKAWHYAGNQKNFLDPEGFGMFVQQIAKFVEWDTVQWSHKGQRFDNLRTSHVGFMDGGSAAPVGEVRERFDRWCGYAYELATYTDLLGRDDAIEHCIPVGEVRERFDRWCGYAYELATYTDLLGRDDAIEHCIKALLDIHPWPDGNGRTASILRNWMLGTLDDPSPLPYYYGNA